MPRFYNDDEEETSKAETASADNKGEIKYWKIFMVLVFFYYFISCGVERIYQVSTFFINSLESEMFYFVANGVHIWPVRAAGALPQ